VWGDAYVTTIEVDGRFESGALVSQEVNVLALSVKSLHKSYGRLHAVNDVSFDVVRGDVFALLGPNGAGKSTTIEILEGFLKRDDGDVRVLGVDPGDRSKQRWLRSRIGVVLQELTVEPFFTVRQVLERNAGYYPTPRRVHDVIDLVGLREKADVKVKRLSGGQQRRLDIGLGIIGNPELLFLDEPTTGLDPAARRMTWELIRALSSEGTTVVLSSHYMDEVEALARHVVVLTGAASLLPGRRRRWVVVTWVTSLFRLRCPKASLWLTCPWYPVVVRDYVWNSTRTVNSKSFRD